MPEREKKQGPHYSSKKAEEMRIRYLYRDLVLRRKVMLPRDGAVSLVGPDCAFHLYSRPYKKSS